MDVSWDTQRDVMLYSPNYNHQCFDTNAYFEILDQGQFFPLIQYLRAQ
jgi:hypothetical protein